MKDSPCLQGQHQDEQNSGKISANSTGKISRALRRAAAYSSRGDPADGPGHEADDAALRQ